MSEVAFSNARHWFSIIMAMIFGGRKHSTPKWHTCKYILVNRMDLHILAYLHLTQMQKCINSLKVDLLEQNFVSPCKLLKTLPNFAFNSKTQVSIAANEFLWNPWICQVPGNWVSGQCKKLTVSERTETLSSSALDSALRQGPTGWAV